MEGAPRDCNCRRRRKQVMPIAMIVNNPVGSQDTYEQVEKQLGLGATPPPGAIFQMAGSRPDGGWRGVSVWESEHDARRFWDERVRPALERVSPESASVQPEVWPLHRYRK